MKLSLTKFLLDVSTKQEIQEKDKVLPWGLECKEPTKRFLNQRNMRKCCQVPTKSQFAKQYRKSIAMATAVTKNLQKSIITTLVVPPARNISENTG